MRYRWLGLVRPAVATLLVITWALRPAGAPAADAPAPDCQPPALGRDRLFLECVMRESAPSQRFHIKVHFTGSHDDTNASLSVAIGDVPVACETGSKTSTESEDGDVTLDCQFAAAGRPGAPTTVLATAKWFHAQYLGLEVERR